MAVETLIPNGDGTRTGTWASTGASFYTEIDDYSGGGSADGATTNVRPPNKTNGATGYFNLTDTSAGFAPTGITQVQVRINFSRVIGTQSGGLDSLTLSVGMVQSDESTVLTDLIAVSGLPTDESFTEQTVTLTNPNTAASKAVWDAGRLKIVQAYSAVDGADGISRLRITAAEVIATYTTGAALTKDLDDPVSLADAAAKMAARITAETLALADASGRAAGRVQADTLALADASSRGPGHGLADALALADGLSRQAGVGLADALTLADAALQGVAVMVSSPLDLTDDVSRAWEAFVAVDEGVALADAAVRSVAVDAIEGLTLADVLAKAIGTVHADGITPADSISQAAPRLLDDALALADELVRVYGLSRVEALGLVDEVVATRGALHELADTITLSDAIVKRLGQGQGELLIVADATQGAVAVAVADALVLSDARASQWGARVQVTDVLDLADLLSNRAGLRPADTLGLTDATARSVQIVRAIADALVLIDLAVPSRYITVTLPAGRVLAAREGARVGARAGWVEGPAPTRSPGPQPGRVSRPQTGRVE